MGGDKYINNNKKLYWVDKGNQVLAFIDNSKPVRLTTYERQTIVLFHTRSGGGVYAFHLQGLIVVDILGDKKVINNDGYFLCSKRKIRRTEFKKKTSMKYQTMKGANHNE